MSAKPLADASSSLRFLELEESSEKQVGAERALDTSLEKPHSVASRNREESKEQKQRLARSATVLSGLFPPIW
jgi:hypothetical protein